MRRTPADQVFTDSELCRRGADTLIASWEQYAVGATGARLHGLNGVAAAVFPEEPERGVAFDLDGDCGISTSERSSASAGAGSAPR